jgi:hypothetical protein
MTAVKMFVAAIAVLAPTSGFAASCEDYPRSVGLDPEALVSMKWIATAAAPVSFDDVSAVNDARTEATMAAKAMIAETLTNSVKRQEAMSRAVEESSSIRGQSKQAKRDELVQRVTTMSSSAEALLRGAIVIGDCYTPGKEYRVTVGIKPETIQAAEELARTTSGSVATTPTPTTVPQQGRQQSQGGPSAAPAAPHAPLNSTSGFSNTQGLTKF